MAVEALRGHIQFMLDDEEEIPNPSTLETILSQPEQMDAIAFLVIQIPDEILRYQEEKQLV